MSKELQYPNSCRYTAEHVWIRKDGAEWLVGITDFAQDQLGEIVYVELPAAGEHFAAADSFGTVESLKSVNTLYMPVSGTVTALNEELAAVPSLVNADCYKKGWMLRIQPDSDADAAALLSAEAYAAKLIS